EPAASVARRDAWARRLPLLPALIYVFLVTQIPFVLTIYYSFFNWNLLKPGSFHFSGLDNYSALLTNESIRTAVLNTVVLTVAVIALSVVLGLAIASLLNSEVFGKGFMRTLMIAPFLIMPTAGALIWKDTLLNPIFGLLPYLLTPFGLGRVDWVNQYPMVTVVVVEVWRWTPFMMLNILAFQGFSIGQASAIGVVAVIITIIVATLALRTLFSIFQVEARRRPPRWWGCAPRSCGRSSAGWWCLSSSSRSSGCGWRASRR